jgi:hypothetical protein
MKTCFPVPELGVEAAVVEGSASENAGTAVVPVRKTFVWTLPTLAAVDQCPATCHQFWTSLLKWTAKLHLNKLAATKKCDNREFK